jgi:hypothetical protein
MSSHAAIAAVVVLLAAVGAVSRAHAVPFDAVTTLVSTNASGLIHFKRDVPGAAAEVSSQSLLIHPDHYSSAAIAETSGFFGSPIVIGPTFLSNLGRAHAEARVENLDRPTIHATARAAATFVYFVEVFGPGPFVPVHIGWSVAGSADGVGFGSGQILVEILSAPRPGGGLIRVNESVINGSRSGVSVVNVDLTDSLPDQLRIELRAQCGTSGLEGVHIAQCSATADPTFSIPSDFPDAASFRLAFSPNLAPDAAVPEPGAIGVSLLALVCLAAGNQIRVVRRRGVVARRAAP